MNLPSDPDHRFLQDIETWADNRCSTPPRPAAQPVSERLFARLSTEVLNQKFAHKTNQVLQVASQYHQALLLTRQRRFREAFALLEQADTECAALDSPNDERSYVRSVALPAHAYFCYKVEEYELAQHYTQEAMTVDEQLESRGLGLLQYHRLQQVHNLSRIEFRRGQTEQALQIGTQLIDYLCGSPAPTLPGTWNRASIDQQPVFMRSAMLCQVVNETLGRYIAAVHQRGDLDVRVPVEVFAGLTRLQALTPDEQALAAWYNAWLTLKQPNQLDRAWIHTQRFFDTTEQPLEPVKFALLNRWLNHTGVNKPSLRVKLTHLCDALRPPAGYAQLQIVG